MEIEIVEVVITRDTKGSNMTNMEIEATISIINKKRYLKKKHISNLTQRSLHLKKLLILRKMMSIREQLLIHLNHAISLY